MGMSSCRCRWALILALGWGTQTLVAQAGAAGDPAAGQSAGDQTAQLVEELRAHEARIHELEEKLAALTAKPAEAPAPEATAEAAAQPEAAAAQETAVAPPEHEHTMQLPGGGPTLKIRGFADFNLGFGSAANSLIFPLPSPVHDTFQFGEFDLFLSSKLSPRVSFLSELIFGSDPTNAWGLTLNGCKSPTKSIRICRSA